MRPRPKHRAPAEAIEQAEQMTWDEGSPELSFEVDEKGVLLVRFVRPWGTQVREWDPSLRCWWIRFGFQ